MTNPALPLYLLEQIASICFSSPSITIDKVIDEFVLLSAAGVACAGVEYSEAVGKAINKYRMQFRRLLEEAGLTPSSTAEELLPYL
jgi:hypothetical protein